MSPPGYFSYALVVPASDRTSRPRDANATKERFVVAAIEEFAAHGLAGARIDEIAERAGANKRLIYAYFGSKDDLFDAVLARTLGVLTDSVPFTADDLVGWAGSLFDRLVAEPHVLRLATWRNFERNDASPAELASYASKLKAIKAAQKSGEVTGDIPAANLLALLMGMVNSWLQASAALRDLGGGADAMSTRTVNRHRRSLVLAVRRVVAPS
jgi:AcrR family transcriptional regulator